MRGLHVARIAPTPQQRPNSRWKHVRPVVPYHVSEERLAGSRQRLPNVVLVICGLAGVPGSVEHGQLPGCRGHRFTVQRGAGELRNCCPLGAHK
jgi:hypothetical protein